jgi:hypothetical protein
MYRFALSRAGKWRKLAFAAIRRISVESRIGRALGWPEQHKDPDKPGETLAERDHIRPAPVCPKDFRIRLNEESREENRKLREINCKLNDLLISPMGIIPMVERLAQASDGERGALCGNQVQSRRNAQKAAQALRFT